MSFCFPRRFSLLCMLLLALPLAAQTPPTVQVQGPGGTQRYTAAQLKQLPHVQLRATGHDGKEHRYAGVPLHVLLQKIDAPQGKNLRGAALSSYLLVRAANNYQALYALPELDLDFTDRTLLLADQSDGQPLPANNDRFQLNVPGEKKQARWVRQVVSITVVLASGKA